MSPRPKIFLIVVAVLPVVVPLAFAFAPWNLLPKHSPGTPPTYGRVRGDGDDRAPGVPIYVNYLSGVPFRVATVSGDIYYYFVQGRDGRILLNKKVKNLQNQRVVVRGCIKRSGLLADNVSYCEVSLDRKAYLEEGGVMPISKLSITYEDGAGMDGSMTLCEIVGVDANAKEYCP